MKKGIITILFSVTAIIGILVWLYYAGTEEIDLTEILMISGVIIVVGFGLFIAIRRIRDARNNLPAEDEMSKKIMQKAASTSYYISLYIWLAFMMFEEKITLGRSTLLGAGILCMAIIFALSWVYYSYFSSKHE